MGPMGIPRHPVMKRLKYSPEQVQIMILGLEMAGDFQIATNMP